MWDLPGPGFEPLSPALAGGFLTTVLPGKSSKSVLSNDITQLMLWSHLSFLLINTELGLFGDFPRHRMVKQSSLSWFLFGWDFCPQHLDWYLNFIVSLITVPTQNHWRSKVFANLICQFEQEKTFKRRLSKECQSMPQYLCSYKCNREF